MLAVIPAALSLMLLCGPPPAANDVAVEIALEEAAQAGARVELLVRRDGPVPRWSRADGGPARVDGTVTLRAQPGCPALVVVRSDASRSYRLDGPFEWPRSPGSRAFHGTARRALHGSDPPGGPASELRLVGAGTVEDPLCGGDGGSEWRCLGVPATFAGRIVACSGRRAVGAAVVRPEADDRTSLKSVSFAAAFRVEGPDSEPVTARARVVRPVTAGGFVFAAEPNGKVADLGDGILWIEASTDEPDRMVEVRAPGYATRRLNVEEIPSACGGAGYVDLRRALDLRGTVSGPAGEPVVGATVLARSDDPAKDPTIFGDATTNEEGVFELRDLETRVYRVRACDGGLGCREERASPGEPVDIVLGGGGAFAGRVLSSAGVPEVDAAVRIVPTAGDWAASPDRVRKLPLQAKTGNDGRFRIAAPEPGDFLLEVRGTEGGVARAPVRRTTFSPKETDLGDLRLVEPIEFTARVPGCGAGWLTFSGPLGGETPLPDVSRFRLDASGSTAVRLGEPGAWTAWATCDGENERLEPAILPDVSDLAGVEVRFERAGRLAEGVEPRR
jgi:hypothetical protein